MGLSRSLVDLFNNIVGKGDRKRLAEKTPFTGLEKHLDIAYSDDGHPMHTLDVYRPEGEGKLPVIIDIHGGGWIYGTKEINAHYCHGLAKYGFVVANINYRLIREGHGGTFPNILNDIFAAYKWTEEHIAEYGGDLSNVFLTGDSAGAHLACLSAAINADPELREELNMKTGLAFRALALTCGVSDVERFRTMKLPLVKYLFRLFLGENWQTHPHGHILSLQNTKLENLPPVFLNSAYGDFLKNDVKKFAATLTERGVENELFFLDEPTRHKLSHVYSVLYPEWEESAATTDALIAFFLRHAADAVNN